MVYFWQPKQIKMRHVFKNVKGRYKMIKKTAFYFLLLLTASCSSVHFDSAMPRYRHSIKVFNSDMVGKYYFCDSILNNENKETIYNSKYYSGLYKSRDSISYISADFSISNKLVYYSINFSSYYNISKTDTSMAALKHKSEKKRIEGNYLIFEDKNTDSIINTANGDKIKYYCGSYYLNHFIAKKDWEIYQFEIKKDNTFSINMINEQDEKQLINETADSRPSLNKSIHLSNRRFKNFIQNGGFRTKYRLKKYPG